MILPPNPANWPAAAKHNLRERIGMRVQSARPLNHDHPADRELYEAAVTDARLRWSTN